VDEPTIEVVHTPEECRVILGGEVDHAAQPLIYAKVVNALADCPDDAALIVIDLERVTFIDSSGIGALVEIRQQALKRSQTVKLRKPDPRVARVLEIARIDTLFTID
jgi:anti-sigma B factor antagonist